MKLGISLSLLCMALLGPQALAGDLGEDAPSTPPKSAPVSTSASDDADLAVKLPNFRGLAGMQDMIDARIPEGLTIRGGVRLQQSREQLEGPLIHFDAQKFDLQAYAGVAALELFEVGARLPFEFNRTSKSFKFDGTTRHSGDSFGDLDLGGKISIRFGQLALAPYALGTLPSGDRRFSHATGGMVGGAASVSIFESRLVLHANVDGAWLEGGRWAIDYRAGMSVVPIASKILLVRPYVYLNGRQEIGDNPGADMRVVAGVQGLLLDLVTVEAGGSFRFLSQATPHEMQDDLGTWAFNIGAGVAF